MKNFSSIPIEDLKKFCLTDKDVKNLLKILKKEDNWIVNEVFATEEESKKKFDTLYEVIKKGFTKDEIRKYPMKFKLHGGDKKNHTMEFRRVISNMIFWKGLRRLDTTIEEKHILPFDITTADIIYGYYDKYFIEPNRGIIPLRQISKVLSDTTYSLSKISLDFNLIMGITVTYENYRNTALKFPEFEKILKSRLDPELSPHEIENLVDELTKKQISLLKQDDESAIRYFLEAEDGIKKDALQEFLVASSNKPDLLGNTMPVTIDRNFMYGGLSNLLNWFVDAVAGRKSIILNKTEMGKSGYFSYRLILVNAQTKINSDEEDCGATRYWNCFVKNKQYLKKLVGRYYYKNKYELDMIKDTDLHLIGRTIKVRTPALCACKKGICKTCYGHLSNINYDILIGGLSAMIISMVIQQKILSSKHTLKTKSMPINFNKEFDEMFILFSNEILIDPAKSFSYNNSKKDMKLVLMIDKNDMVSENSFDKDLTNKDISKFYLGSAIISSKNKAKEFTKLQEYCEERNSPFNLTETLANSPDFHYKDGFYYIELEKIDDEMVLFTIDVENNEITKPLYDFKAILDTKGHRGYDRIDDILTALLDCTIEGGIPVNSVDAELLLHPLIRRKDDILERPNFRRHVFDDDIQILSMSSALKNNKSIVIKLASDDLMEQFTDLSTYNVMGESFLDNFFRERINPIIVDAYERLSEDEDWESDDYES